MMRRLVVASVAVVACVILLPSSRDSWTTAASPCESRPAPRPPTGLRIILSELLAPITRGVPVLASAAGNEYFETAVSRPECRYAYALRSQAGLDSLPTVNKHSEKKLPLVYDPVQDAAKISIYAPSSTDIQGKLMPLRVTSGTMLLAWDFKFDKEFRWLGEGYMQRHKTWRLLPGPWLAIRTDYRHAANQGEFAEVYFTMPASRFLGPGTTRGAPGWFGEMLQPQLATFYFRPDTWVRVWIFVEGLDQAVCYMSIWAADENRDAVQLYNNIALLPNHEDGGLAQFQIEYDTSGDMATNPNMAYSWNRNVFVLHNVSRAAVLGLLKRPVP